MLCSLINLQDEVRDKVTAFYNSFDFECINAYLRDFYDYSKMNSARLAIQDILGDDEDNIKILTCMLKGAIDAYEFYIAKSIDDKIYIDTMKCFTRFIRECRRITGKYAFDREWWTARQVGCHLFRLGELEYEFKETDDKKVVSIHIPSDTIFSKKNCDKSLELVKIFIKDVFPEYLNCDFVCHSWLLSPELKKMLNKNSNILIFQSRFKIVDMGEPSTEFIEWLFHTRDFNINSFEENTSLQRNMKKFLLDGGAITEPLGIMI